MRSRAELEAVIDRCHEDAPWADADELARLLDEANQAMAELDATRPDDYWQRVCNGEFRETETNWTGEDWDTGKIRRSG